MKISGDHLRQSNEAHENWGVYLSLVRIGLLLFIAVGVALQSGQTTPGLLLFFLAVGLVASAWDLLSFYLHRKVSARQARFQILVDFLVVATTVAFTNGAASFFTFIFVLVVLESVLVLGLTEGVVLSTLATLFMVQQMLFGAGPLEEQSFELWYKVLGNCLAFYLTAFISGYWRQRIRRMQEFQREILDNMNTGFLITDAKGAIIVMNGSARDILETGNLDPVGKSVSDVLIVESGGECPVITALRATRDFTSYEFRARTRMGRQRLLGLTTNCMLNDRGQLTGVIASFSDLTEMDRMRREMRRHDRMAVVGELAAGLSHEIRNPVAVIRGAVEEMGALDQNDPLHSKLRVIAMRESDHLNEIVSGFLDFARQPSLRRDTFDVREVVQEVSELLKREYESERGLRITTDCARDSCTISGDRSQIKQVIVNLAKNAIEAMSAEGNLRFVVANGQGPVEIRLEDEGPGIAPDDIERIFEPFYTTKESGVGMGLAVCERIISAHDGIIRASSREEGGCSMVVRLPAIKPEDIE